MTRADQKEYKQWLELCDRIRSQTTCIKKETTIQQSKRKAELQGNFVQFCEYYFPHYLDSKFGWFHKKAAKAITGDDNIFCILEWPREHAKSVFANLMMPLFLYARGEITGMVVASANETKAKTLLADIQAEFESNQLFISDYGNLTSLGDWQTGHFTTTEGIGFWAFGRGQSPRGIRKAAKRPNYAVIDDIDDKVICKNEKRVKEAVDWVLEDLYGALGIKGSRVIVAGNRIHKKSILAHLVGDIEPKDPKREGITHIKVYAIETQRHAKSDPQNGRPAWKERYTIKQLVEKMTVMGYRASRREYFHEHIEEGNVFRNEWIHWVKPKNINNYDHVILYTDPSFKETKKNDYKATVVIGKHGNHLDVLYAWVRQASISSMVKVHYDKYEEMESHAQYYMEANFMQDLLLDDFTTEGKARGYQMPIRGDKRNKPNKYSRIENLSPLFERGLIRFNERERKNPDMQTLIQQLLGFPDAHDDGPDAMEGGIFLLQGRGRASAIHPRTGRYRKNSNR